MDRESGGIFSKVFNSPLFSVASILLAAFVVFSYARIYYSDYQIKKEIQELNQQSEALKTKKSQMLETLNYMDTDDFLEEKARMEFNMVKPGEHVMVVEHEGENVGDGQVKGDMLKLNNIPNYKKWWNMFMH